MGEGSRTIRGRRGVLGALVVAAVAAGLVACAGATGGGKPADPAARAQDKTLGAWERDKALGELLSATGDPRSERGRALVAIVQDERAPDGLRRKAFAALAADAGTSETAREVGRRLLPVDHSRVLVAEIAKTAGERGWSEYIPALVRAYRRPLLEVSDADRTERAALGVLAPGRSVEETILEVFLHPPADETKYGFDWRARARADAWDLLGRLDSRGTLRARVFSGGGAGAGEDDAVGAIRACATQLRAVPITGAELEWARALRDVSKPANAAWWREVVSVMGGSFAGESLQLRHGEAIRWAGAHHSAWVSASVEQLARELEHRLGERKTHARSWGTSKPTYAETFKAARGKLSRADLLTLLVVDEAIHQPAVVHAVFTQAELDANDMTTEYGGVLRAKDGARFEAVMYPPRPSERRGDREFIASRDMIAASDTALGHYHLHCQHTGNGDYAGPSEGDREYAAASGRTCVVFTSIAPGIMDADFYQPDGVVVDLGEIRVSEGVAP